MNFNKTFLRRLCLGTVCAFSVFLSACGLADAESIFTDPVKLDVEARNAPKFWEASVPVPGSSNLYELDNDLFLGKPYNDLYRFGDDILLVAEGYYKNALFDADEDSSEISYEYSFDVYSPWRDRILYSLRHQDIHCDSYQVVGDALFLYDYENLELSVYDSKLKKTGKYDLSELYHGSELQFYATTDASKYYVTSEDASDVYFATLHDGAIELEGISMNAYGIQPGGSSSSGAYLAVAAVDPVTLGYRLAVLDADTTTIAFTIPGDSNFVGDVSDSAFVGMTNAYEAFWVYRNFTQENVFFRCDNISQMYVFNDGTFATVCQDFNTDTENYPFSLSHYDSDGSCISNATYYCGDLNADGVYPSNHQALFSEDGVGFVLAYNANLQPYLIVWDMRKAGGSENDLQFYSSEEELAQNVESYYYEAYEETTNSEYGYKVTEITNPDTYDWGPLYSINQKATALEEKYHVSIYLGPEVPEKIDHFYLHKQLNSSILSAALDDLEKSLACYPENFFSQLAFGGNRGMRIYLSGNITGDGVGVLEEASGFVNEINSYMVMVLNTNSRSHWDYTIAHELSHMIDRRLDFRNTYVSGNLFSEDTWASYNPEDFSYLMAYDGYEDSNSYELYSDFFLDSYSITYPTEDRAVLFGTAMSDYMKGITTDDAFSNDSPTALKYEYYCQCIRNGFDTTGWSSPLPWEAILSK